MSSIHENAFCHSGQRIAGILPIATNLRTASPLRTIVRRHTGQATGISVGLGSGARLAKRRQEWIRYFDGDILKMFRAGGHFICYKPVFPR